MSMIGAALIGGGLGLASAKQTNQANKDMSRDQMKFQAAMSSTAYQRAKWDMEKAGLNPTLLASGGAQAASTPAGSTATMQNVGSKAMQSAISTAQTLQGLEKGAEDIKTQKAQTDYVTANARAVEAEARYKEEMLGTKANLWEHAEKVTHDLSKPISSAYQWLKDAASDVYDNFTRDVSKGSMPDGIDSKAYAKWANDVYKRTGNWSHIADREKSFKLFKSSR